MHVRDEIKNADYFESKLDRLSIRIHRHQQTMIELSLSASDKKEEIRATSSTLAIIHEGLFNSMYSAGYPIEDLKPVFSKWIEYERGSFPDPSLDILYLLPFYSPAVLFGMTETDRENLQYLADIIPGNDPICFLLANYLGLTFGREEGAKSRIKYFEKFRHIEGKKEQEEFLGTYLRRYWYTSNKRQYWWGIHKSDTGAYEGYWAFDIAAVVKACGLDDSSFVDFKYYPRDMVHFIN